MNYLSVKETAIKWDVSERRVQKLYEDDRIEGGERFGAFLDDSKTFAQAGRYEKKKNKAYAKIACCR